MSTASPAGSGRDGPRRRLPERRAQIERAAVQLFYEKGYAETSMEDIGAAIGIRGPSLYKHFASKMDILLSAVGWIGEDFFAEFDAMFEAVDDPQLRLAKLVDLYVHWVADDPVRTAVALEARKHGTEADDRATTALDRRLLDGWVAALRSARPELDRHEARLQARGALDLVRTVSLAQSRVSPARRHDVARRAMLGALLG